MRYDFDKMDADSFELMIRSLNHGIFGVKCEQYGLGPDGQREFVYEGTMKDNAGNVFEGRTIGQVKYKYPTTKQDDFSWLKSVLMEELQQFREKEEQYRPDNYLFYTNVVLTPAKDTGIKDKIDAFLEENNDIIPHIYVRGYDEICALLDNNRDVATSYACHILSGDVLMQLLRENEFDYSGLMQRYLARELEEDMYTRMEQAGSVTEKKISIEKVCVDIDVIDRRQRKTMKFAQRVLELGNGILGYRKEVIKDDADNGEKLRQDENFVLIGGPGRGKTTICQFIAQIYRANYLKETGYGDPYSENFISEIKEKYEYTINCFRIPFKITLREYAAWIGRQGKDGNCSVVQYIRTRIQKITGEELKVPMIRQMLKQMAWIFFFDGLDEVPESSNRSEILKQIDLFITTDLREARCDCMIIGTSRMQGYNNDFDETRYQHLEVAELSKQDCEKYVIKLFEVMEEQTDKREEYISIIREAMEDDTTNRLMKTPLQATIISILVKSGGKPPHERYSLFRQYYDTMVRREKQKGVMATLNDHTDWLQEIHFLVADRLQRESEREGNPSAEISKGDFNELIKKYIIENLDEFYEKPEEIDNKTDEFMKTVTDRICFLCENREGYYSFSIRTMQEYFAGTYLVKGVGDDEAMQNMREIAYKSYWRNVLLFALGYIELEKKNLEKGIGNLCAEMNGRDNLVQAEYTAENVCLFGSWLALDILAEDIFKGKNQNKYIEIATKALPFFETSNYNKFAFITGVQCSKLCSYVKENYQNKPEYREPVFSLYMKLAENEKNNMEQKIDELLNGYEEPERIKFCIRLLEEDVLFSEDWILKWEQQLLDFVSEEKVLLFLPTKVLVRLLHHEIVEDIAVRRFLFIQCLHNRDLSAKSFRKFFKEQWMKEIYEWLTPNRHVVNSLRVKIIPEFEYSLVNITPAEEYIREFRSFAKSLQAEYYVQLCDYVLHPDFSEYVELKNALKKEPPYLLETFSKYLVFRAPCKEKEEYDIYQKKKEEFYRLFCSESIKRCMKQSVCPGLSYSATCVDSVLNLLIQKGKYPLKDIHELGDDFFKSYLFAAHVQLESTAKSTPISDATRRNLLVLLKEAERRKIYGYQMYVMIVVLIASKYRDELFEKMPDLFFGKQLLEERRNSGQDILEEYSCISADMLSEVISHVVRRCAISQQENNYLQILPLLLYKNIDCTKCISEHDLKELDKISYQNAVNRLVVDLLKLYCGHGDSLLIEGMFQLNVPRQTVYSWLVNMLDNLWTENSEAIGVKLYLMLQAEQFEESGKMQNRLFEILMENRSNAMKRL